MFHNFWQRLRGRNPRLETEIDEEISFHLEMRERENLRAGMSSQQAKAAALKGFGDAAYFKRQCLHIKRQYRAQRTTKMMKLLEWPLIIYGLMLRVIGIHQ